MMRVAKQATWVLSRTSRDIVRDAAGYTPVFLQDGMWRVGDYRVIVVGYPSDVYLTCSCPFWQWQGPEYWAYRQDYLYGKPRGTASRPKQKDPQKDHRCCKHVAAVILQLTSKGVDRA